MVAWMQKDGDVSQLWRLPSLQLDDVEWVHGPISAPIRALQGACRIMNGVPTPLQDHPLAVAHTTVF